MKPKLYLINGPLGAGKTTILRQLIAMEQFRDARIIENEFASTSIDTEQLHDHQAEVRTIAGVCICCSTGNELVETLRSLAASPEPVIIEATGVANSLQLVEKLAVADMFEHYSIAQSLFVLDALEAGSEALALYEDELKAADIVLVTKTDLLPQKDVAVLLHALETRGVGTTEKAIDGEFNTSLLGDESSILTYFANHEAETKAHDTGINYTIVTLDDAQISAQDLQSAWPKFVELYSLKRMKGDAKNTEGQTWHYEATRGQLRVTKGDESSPSQLVFIGERARDITKRRLLDALENE